MELNDIVNIVGSVGFPIVACLFGGYMSYKLQNVILALTVTLEKLDERVSHIEDKLINK